MVRCVRPTAVLALVALMAAGLVAGSGADARVFYARDEALRLAFPDADQIDTQTLILTAEQTRTLEALARARFDSRLVAVHVGRRNAQVLGYATIDIHTVRTQPEAVMVVLSPEGRVESAIIVAFHEPLDYLPSGRWMRQFQKRTLSTDLTVGQGIAAITGATLSANGVTESVRRALALYQLILAPARR
jgi:hypothetical protein